MERNGLLGWWYFGLFTTILKKKKKLFKKIEYKLRHKLEVLTKKRLFSDLQKLTMDKIM